MLRRPWLRLLPPQATRRQLPFLPAEPALQHFVGNPRIRLALHPDIRTVGRPAVRRDTAHTASHRGARLGRQVLRLAAQPARDIRATLGRLCCRVERQGDHWQWNGRSHPCYDPGARQGYLWWWCSAAFEEPGEDLV